MKRLQDALIARRRAEEENIPLNHLAEGYWWKGMTAPGGAYTMLGTKRLNNLAHLLKKLDDDGVSGQVMEAGVWRGGTLAWMARHTERGVWGFDSFQGCPKPEWQQDKGNDYHDLDFLKVPIEEVQKNLRKFLAFHVHLVPGWISDTVPEFKRQPWALLRLDLDMYEGTWTVLNYFYRDLERGGYCIIDDYQAIAEVRQAVDDFRELRGITSPLTFTDHTEAVWKK
jgi:O-methyltransferase